MGIACVAPCASMPGRRIVATACPGANSWPLIIIFVTVFSGTLFSWDSFTFGAEGRKVLSFSPTTKARVLVVQIVFPSLS